MQGAQARFDRENAKGGVFGRKIKIVDTADDKFDPTTNVQEARRVVSSGDVFAMVPTVTVVLGASDYLAQQKVPFFGWGISSGFCGNDYGYGFTGCVAPKTPEWGNTFMPAAGAKALNKDPKGLTVAIIAEDTDAARSGLGTLGTAAESLGMKVVYSKGVVPAPPATVGDFTPFSQAIMTSNNGGPPDIVIMLFASIPSTLGLQGALQADGFKGPIENTQTYDPQLAGAVEGWQRLRAVRCVRDRRHRARRQADGDRPEEGGRTARRAERGRLPVGRHVHRRAEEDGEEPHRRRVPEGGEQAQVQRREDGRADDLPARTGCSPACAGRS